jgi:hypothetical protein
MQYSPQSSTIFGQNVGPLQKYGTRAISKIIVQVDYDVRTSISRAPCGGLSIDLYSYGHSRVSARTPCGTLVAYTRAT